MRNRAATRSRTAGRGLAWVLGLLLAFATGLAVVWLAVREPRTEMRRTPEAAQGALPAVAPLAAGAAASVEAETPALPAPEPARRAAEPAPAGGREVLLLLERFPDHAPIAHALVDIEPHAEEGLDSWLGTDGEGRVRLQVPAGATRLRVRTAGFEPGEATLPWDGAELRLALVSSAALFGRVLHPDRTPAAEATVELLAVSESVHLHRSERSPAPRAIVQTNVALVTTARTDTQGEYVLEAPAPWRPPAVEVRARLGELEARWNGTLPRSEALPDLVLGPVEGTLLVRVIDLDGRPIPDALVMSRENPLARGSDRTDARGELVLPTVTLPATFYAYAQGFLAREWRHDGLPVEPPGRLQAPIEVLEIVMAPAGGVRVRVVDAQTRLPIYLAHGACELVTDGEVVGGSDWEPDRQGEAWVSFVDTYQLADPPIEPELARLTLEKEGYEPGQTFELDARAAPGPEPIELALRPLAGGRLLRGRVLRAGEPLARFQVGMKVQPRVASSERAGWQYGRTYTDAEGRFALRWQPAAFEQIVTLYPHWTSWDEFAFLGPLSEEEATGREQVLELRPAIRVPALVRGVVRGGSYRYYVALLEEHEAEPLVVPTTINGIPLRADSDGELRTLLRLPADRRVQVTVGYVSAGRVHADGSAPVVHDPARPELPLVLELEPLFLRVRGRVSGFAWTELAKLGVGLFPASPEESQASGLTRLQPDGSFELQAPRGAHELCLLDATPGAWSAVLARQSIDLQADVEGLLLVPDATAPAPR